RRLGFSPVVRPKLAGHRLDRDTGLMGPPRLDRRILALAAAQVATGLLVLWLAPAMRGAPATPAAVLGFAAAFCLASLLPVQLEFGRGSYAVVLDEAILVVGLFVLPPAGLVVAAVGGDLLARALVRQAPLKAAYNAGSWLLASSVSVAVFAAAGSREAGDPRAWLAALAAMAALSAA